MRKVFIFSFVMLLGLAACQEDISLEVEDERHEKIWYEPVPFERAVEELSFEVPELTEFPFEQGGDWSEIYQSTEDRDQISIMTRYVREGVELNYEDAIANQDAYEFVDFTVANYEAELNVHNAQGFETMKLGSREVKVRYESQLPSITAHWMEDGQSYQLTYVNAYAREDGPEKQNFVDAVEMMLASFE
ncbi:hypothetical protein LCM20_08340 [Halobacillus litoralis]|uniref:hypothetical protein n=1 Tax=Halobacillus litoralis TaxID=45668 RepID=UPI001CD6098F|nr:hypothetical protein [Halobacillus litoralis]MCA0970592.1 hypothetical protein [Halobacillus litoralis]